jgi:hypothetical protein
MNSMQTTSDYPAEKIAVVKIKKGERFFHTPNQSYGGKKRHTPSTRQQTKAVGTSFGDNNFQMNRPKGYSTAGGKGRVKNQLFKKGAIPEKADIQMPASKHGTHPINRGMMNGVYPTVKKQKTIGSKVNKAKIKAKYALYKRKQNKKK